MIRSIQWNNDPILGNLYLNFQKDDGSIYNTIVFAGENGTGKTSVLETMSEFLNLGSIEPFQCIEYDANGDSFTITPNAEYAKNGWHNRKKKSDNSLKRITSNKNNNKASIERDEEDIRHYGCVYSKARSGFQTKPIKYSTTEQIDSDRYDEDNNEDFTSIKQLIVDIKSQDNSTWDRIGARGENITYQQFHLTSKIYRFEKAFNDFLETLKFSGVNETAIDEKKVEFVKNNQSIEIDDLSTGEKQVVFRGSQLLRNSNNLNGGVVLIDEPELSMHPKWQSKVFDYYRGLFTKNGEQSSQMFFATHSENVIRAAVEDKENVLIIILSDENGIIKADKMNDIILPSVTSAEINYLAFDVKTVDYHIALYGYIQAKTGKSRIAEVDTWLSTQSEYNSILHEKIDSYGTNNYKTLSTYIRNAIDHPDSGRVYNDEDLTISIQFLRSVCKRLSLMP